MNFYINFEHVSENVENYELQKKISFVKKNQRFKNCK